MADKSISQLSPGVAVTDTDLLPNVQVVGVGPVKTTAVQIKTYVNTNPNVTGVIKAQLGSAAAPSYTFDGDLNTGWWSPAADTLAASTNGTEKIRITSAGNVGIGVTPVAPSNLILNLQVGSKFSLNFGNTTSAVSYNSYYDGNFKYITNDFAVDYRQNNNNGSHAWFIAPSGTAGNVISYTAAMTLNASGNLGIGTTSPATRTHIVGTDTELRVQSDTTANGFIRFINTSGSMSVGMSGGPTNTLLTYDRTNSQTAHEYLGGASGYHAWSTVGQERMRIDNIGNVGIGQVAVTPVFGRTISAFNASGATYRVAGSSVSAYLYVSQGLGTTGVSSETNHPLVLGTNSTERMRIGSNGNVAIGTGSTYGRLTIVPATTPGSVANANQIWIGEATSNSDYRLQVGYYLEPTTGGYVGSLQAYAAAVAGNMVLQGAGGNLGVGIVGPGARLDVEAANVAVASDGIVRIGANSSGADVGGQITFRNSNARRASIAGRQEGADPSVAGYLQFGTRGTSGDITERMRIDSSGNVGIGTTPSVSWGAPFRALVIGGNSFIVGRTDSIAGRQLQIGTNAIFNGTSWIYGASQPAAKYYQNDGQHIWEVAGSGTAGNAITFTQAMTLDANGRLGIGATSPTSRLTIDGTNGNVASQIQLVGTGVLSGYIGPSADGLNLGTDSGGILFRTGVTGNASVTTGTERMRITSSGDVGIGTTNPAGKLDVAGNNTSIYLRSNDTNDATLRYFVNSVEVATARGKNGNIFAIETGGTERMRIDGNGNVVINTAGIATNATNGFLYVPSCAGTPTGTPTAYAGRVPIVVDTTNNKLYFYSGSAWRDAGP